MRIAIDNIKASVKNPWLALIALQGIACYVFTVNVSHFVADDLRNLEQALQYPLWDYLVLPVDVHIVPLHRLVTYLLQHGFPMSFDTGTLFFVACHTLSLVFLYRLLQLLHASSANLVVLFLYTANYYLLENYRWWSAGLHRFPYLLLAIASCYCFTRFHIQQRWPQLGAATVCYIAATAFFIKGILIPLYLLGIVVCLFDATQPRASARSMTAAVALVATAVGYGVWYATKDGQAAMTSQSLSKTLIDGMSFGLGMTAQSLMPMMYSPRLAPWVNGAWIAVVIACVARRPRTALPIGTGIALIALNFAMIAGSSKSSRFGLLILLSTRYYFEVLFIAAIFFTIALKWARSSPDKPPANAERTSPGFRRTLVLAIALVYMAAHWRTTVSVMFALDPNQRHYRASRYARNLIADLERFGDLSKLGLLDGAIPTFFSYGGLHPKPMPLSRYLALYGIHPGFSDPRSAVRFVDDDGHIVPRDATR